MEAFGFAGSLIGGITLLVCACFAIGTFFALPMIWYHIGHVSRKLDKVIALLESVNTVAEKKDKGD